MRTEQSHGSWLVSTATRLEAEAAQLESRADEEEAYSCGSMLMGGTAHASHRYDMDRCERLRAEARDKRARAAEYRRQARQQQ